MKNDKHEVIKFKNGAMVLDVDVNMDKRTVWLSLEQMSLLFNKDTYVSFETVYIADSGCKVLRDLFSSNEDNDIEKYDPPINRVAMVLLINELFSINGNVTYSNVSTILLSNGIEVTQSTIKKVLEETSEKRDQPYKHQPQH